MLKSTFWTERRFTGILLILGCLLFLTAAGIMPRDAQGNYVVLLPDREALLVIAAQPTLFQWSFSLFISGIVVTPLGLAMLTRLLRDAHDRTFSYLALITSLFAAGLMVIYIAVPLGIDPWAAQETASTGVVPNYYMPLDMATQPLFVLYTILSFSALAAYGGAVLTTHMLPRWLGWLAIVYGLAGLLFVWFAAGDVPPFLHYLLPIVIGVLLLLPRYQCQGNMKNTPSTNNRRKKGAWHIMEVNRSVEQQESWHHTRIGPMSVQHAPTKTVKHSPALDTRLQRRWLLLARVGWIVLVFLTLTIFFASLPMYVAQLQTLCAGTLCQYQQLTPGQVETLRGIGMSLGDYTAYTVAFTLANMILCLVVSTLIVWHRSDDRMAMLVALMLVTLGPISVVATFPSSSPSPWLVPNRCLLFLFLALFLLVFFLFPSGQFVPRWTRWTFVVILVVQILANFFPDAPLIPNSLVGQLGWLVALGELMTLALVQLYRYRRVSSPLERQQTKWVVFGIAVPITINVIVTGQDLLFPALAEHSSLYLLAFNESGFLLALFIPLAFGFAMLRYRLWAIDLIINRTLVYSILTASVIVAYVLVVGILSTLLHTFGNFLIALLATGLIAVLFQPLRARLQRIVNRLMYGERDDPYAVLSRLGKRLEATLVPEKVLPTIVETVAQALKLPYVAIALLPEQPLFIETATQTTSDLAATGSQALDIVASFGTPTTDPLQVPLVYQAETVGCLLLAARVGDTFGKADSHLLADLARQVGVAVYTVRLTTHLQHLSTGLQQARERLVTTREEERRRLRRDLHDGLGPQLSSQTLTLAAARKLLRQDPDATDKLLVDATTHAQEAIADIRRLVYALRPPALDDLGLLAALQEQLTQYHASGVTLTLNVPERLPPLPAAVEVACYRIAQEALTNVMRHAHAQRCSVHLSVDEYLVLEVRDDGQGFPPLHQSGIGLTSMRERAEELGGSCTITSAPDDGTRVLVCLPLTREREKHAREKGAVS